jgi:hypothetical protein
MIRKGKSKGKSPPIAFQTLFVNTVSIFKKFINNSRGKYKRKECLINVCKSDKDMSWFT